MAFNNHEFVLQAGVLGRPRSFTLTVGDTYASFTNANWKEAVKSLKLAVGDSIVMITTDTSPNNVRVLHIVSISSDQPTLYRATYAAA